MNLAPQARTLEGFLFPATYHLPRHQPRKESRGNGAKIRENGSTLRRRAPTKPASGRAVFCSRPLRGIIVEGETPNQRKSDRCRRVLKRLKQACCWQCDTTVNYDLEPHGTLPMASLSGKD